MDIEVLATLRPELERFARRFDDCIKTRPSQAHLRTYLSGQLSELARKSVEPIALQAGVAPRTLQEFLAFHRWDDRAMRDRVQQIVARDHAHAESIGVIDETSFAKKGDKTPGVQRQHCGATGKTENCVVTVHLGYVAGDFHALLDGDLYLPEHTWHEDRRRCEKAGIPDRVVYRPKWRIGLELVQGAVKRGVFMKWLCADELYGRTFAFRQGIAEMGITYVVEVPCDTSGWLPRRLSERKPRPAYRLWRRGGPSWETWKIKTTHKGAAVWRVRAVRFRPTEERIRGDEQWLLIAQNVLDKNEVKYFLSNAPADTPLKTLLYVAFSRWHIEQIFRQAKNETGLDHYEGRCYIGLMRHLVLTSVSLLYLAEQRQRLKAEKGGARSRSSRSAGRWRSSSTRVSPVPSVAAS